MKITTKGQVTIPQDVREEFGLLPNTEVEFVRDGRGGVRLQKSARAGTRGAELVAALRGKWRSKLRTDDVMAMTRGES
jgi:AbrB family looped-hinge helix DNA binding protein